MSVSHRRPLRLVVDAELAGTRLDSAVGGLEEVGSRAEAQRLIDAARVRVDGEPRAKRHCLILGETVEVEPHLPVVVELTPQSDVPFTVRYEDDHLLVVEKPAGIVTHPSAGHADGTLVHGLLAHAIAGGADPTRPGIVHRLDRDTSGVLVVAKSERTHRRLQRLLRKREITRVYTVMVHGHAPPARTVDRPIGRDPRVRTRMSVRVPEGRAREATTHLRLREQLGDYALLEARLDTGRTHQIRVHLEAEGLPVVGDQVYGRRPNPFGLERQFLHSSEIAFRHPETDAPIQIVSELPDDLRTVLEAIRASAAASRADAPRRRWS